MILRKNAAANSIHIGKTLPQARAQCANRDPDTGGEGRNGEGRILNIFVRARKAPQPIPVGLGKAADKARAEMGRAILIGNAFAAREIAKDGGPVDRPSFAESRKR